MRTCLPPKPFLTNAQFVRASRRLTLDELSAATMIHTSDLSRIERGVRPPSKIQRERMAEALGLEPAEVDGRP